jgi:F-type H+-transporting ATPase subunit a
MEETAAQATGAAAQAAEGSGIHISLAAERIGSFLGIPITNSMLTAWLVTAILLAVAYLVGRNPQLIPSRVQATFEWMIEFVIDFMEQTLESREAAKKYFPLVFTLFIFILFANLTDFIPIFGSFVIHHAGESTPLFRPANSDLNMTLALAIIAVIAIEVIGIMSVGALKYAGKFFNFRSPLGFVVGLIEFVSELSRFISFSFRLFGNIFAGEVMLAVAGFFLPLVLPVPLMGFELFVGFVQAAVFAMLTLFFIKLAITDPHAAH